MKKLIFTAMILLSIPMAVTAQTTGYVNTETILSEMPEYTQAQEQLERLKKQYELQFENELKVIENLFNQYQSQKAGLNEVQRQARENEIISKERSLKQREQEIFGQEGTLATRSKELLDPIKEIVQAAIDKVATERGMLLVFDVATTQGIIFRDSKADLTPQVMSRLGLIK